MSDPTRNVPRMQKGDIVATRIIQHYALGRVNADGKTQTPIEVQITRTDALARACFLAGEDHRVFLYPRTGSGLCVRITCPEKRLDP
jgi:hypothetical protein